MEIEYSYKANKKEHELLVKWDAQQLNNVLFEQGVKIPDLPNYATTEQFIPYFDQLARTLSDLGGIEYGQE